MSNAHPRAGLPLALRLIIATSALVIAAVLGATWSSLRAIGDLAASQATAQQASGEQAIARESELIAGAVASAVALPLATSAYADLAPVLAGALADDAARGDERVQWLVVSDAQGQVVSHTEHAPAAAELARLAALAPVAAGRVVHARVTDDDVRWVYATEIRLGDKPVGTLHLGVSTAGLQAEVAHAVEAASARASHVRRQMLVIAGMVLVLAILLAFVQGAGLARPIEALTRGAHRIAQGDLQHRVAIARRDELGVLAHSFNDMAERIGLLLQERAHQVALEREMDMARTIQRSMLPAQTAEHCGALRWIGYCEPASSCGGDWWTFRKLANERVLIVLGDATGHGIHSAMIAATARGAVEALASVDERLLTPEQVLRAIDSAIRDVGNHDVMMTAFAALFDGTTGQLLYANAGQNFPYVLGVDQAAGNLVGDASVIAASGNPLGDRSIGHRVAAGTRQLRPGDLFVCFSDGLVERQSRTGKLFGDRRLRNALRGQRLGDAATLTALRDHVLTTAAAFADGVALDDDLTVVLCQYDPSAVARRAWSGAA